MTSIVSRWNNASENELWGLQYLNQQTLFHIRHLFQTTVNLKVSLHSASADYIRHPKDKRKIQFFRDSLKLSVVFRASFRVDNFEISAPTLKHYDYDWKFNRAKIAFAAVAPIPTALLTVGAIGLATSPTAKIPSISVSQFWLILM